MATATFPNGHAYSDNSAPGTLPLDNDGHRENFIPLVTDIIGVANTATTNAGTATTKAGEASTSATAAAASATAAASSAATASGHAGTASTQATAAAGSATAAASSASAASTSAGTASTQATNAANSATAAATSATNASTSAAAAATSETNASTSAAAAAASAASAVSAPGTNATSTTSLTVGTGSKSLTIQTGKAFVVGMSVKIARTASPGNWMAGDITAYNSGTGALTVNSVLTSGSGTVADWTVSLTAPVSGSSGSVTSGANTFTDDQTILAAGGNGLTLNTVAAASSPEIATTGADTDIPLLVSAKGAASIRFRTAGTAEQLRVAHTASAVDWLQVTGAATGGAPDISAQGSDTNIGLTLSAKGTGVLSFRTGGNVEQFRVGHTASAVNYFFATGSVTTAALDLAANGSDTNIGITLSAKGTGTLTLRTGGTVGQFEVSHTASAVNRVRATGGAAGGAAVVSAVGSDTDVTLALASQAAGAVSLRTNGTVEQFRALHVASAVDYVQAAGAATGGTVAISAQGSDTNIPLTISTKGTGVLDLRTGATVVQFRIGHTGSAVNYLQADGAATGGAPGLSAKGSDTNVGTFLASQGTGAVELRTNGTVVALQASHTASGVNYARVAPGATGGPVTLSAQGSDTNIDLALMAKGTGGIGLDVADPVTNTIDTALPVVSNIVAMAASAMDLSAGEFFTKTINGAFSPTFSNIPASRRVSWELLLTHTSGAITWPASVIWNEGTTPTLTTGKVHKFFFSTSDGGTTVRAAVLKNYAS
jgi:hypothetical protein